MRSVMTKPFTSIFFRAHPEMKKMPVSWSACPLFWPEKGRKEKQSVRAVLAEFNVKSNRTVHCDQEMRSHFLFPLNEADPTKDFREVCLVRDKVVLWNDGCHSVHSGAA